MKGRKIYDLSTLGIAFVVIILINVMSAYVYQQWDWTEENRYSLTPSTENIIDSIDRPLYVRVLLDGKFPAGFKRLQSATRDFLRELQSRNGLIEVEFEDPSEGTAEEINQGRKKLSDRGIMPVNFRLKEGDGYTERLIYPYAIMSMGEEDAVVNLLEEQTPGMNDEVTLNNSISLLEYKFANAIQKLLKKYKPLVVFTSGHNELDPKYMADFRNEVDEFYRFATLKLDSTTFIPPSVELLIVPKPVKAFDEKEKFIIDQYVMNGGSVLWLIDKLKVNLDSLRGKEQFIPPEMDLNLEDLFFKYGFRINPDLVLDLQCSQIPLQVGMSGGRPQFDLFPWYYHPLVQPPAYHPVTKNLGRVNLYFASSIDSIKTKYKVEKTSILTSSEYSMRQLVPMRLNFKILHYDPDLERFNKSNLPMGYLYEGKFASLYENRMTEDMRMTLEEIELEFLKESPVNTRMAVISDGDFIKNVMNPNNDEYRPLGYNPYDRRTYDNKDFIVNLVEYLINGEAVLSARNKEVQLRLLDRVQAQEEKSKWQFINIGLPLLFLLVFGLLFNYIRRRKYAN
jgi:gliding-associated putative ABC transporter substrate-binding component GldG